MFTNTHTQGRTIHAVCPFCWLRPQMNHHLVHQKNKVPVFVLANVLQLGPGIDSFSIGKSYLKNLSFGNLDFHNVIKKGNSCILMFVLVD